MCAGRTGIWSATWTLGSTVWVMASAISRVCKAPRSRSLNLPSTTQTNSDDGSSAQPSDESCSLIRAVSILVRRAAVITGVIMRDCRTGRPSHSGLIFTPTQRGNQTRQIRGPLDDGELQLNAVINFQPVCSSSLLCTHPAWSCSPAERARFKGH